MARSQKPLQTYPAAFAATFVAYAAAALLGLQWSVIPGAGTAVWPAAGVAYAAFVLGGLRFWPAVLLARLAVAAIVGSPQPWWVDLLIAGATTLAAWLPVRLAMRSGGIDPELGRMRDMLWLALGGGIGGAVISATGGAAALALGGLPLGDLPRVWINWSAGYAVGALTLAPLLLSWSRRSARRMPGRRWAHLLLCLATVAAAAYFTFLFAPGVSLPSWYVYPPLIWAALAFQVRGAAAALVVTSAFALASAVADRGVLTMFGDDVLSRVFFGQQFVAVTAFTVLFLAAVADERRGAARLRESRATTGLALQAGRMTSWRWDMRTGQMTAEGGSSDLFGYPPGTTLPAAEIVARTHPEDQAEMQRVSQEAIAARRTWSMEYRYVGPGGQVDWLSTSIRPVFEAGRLTHLIGVSQIVTDRKRADEYRQLMVNELNHRVKNTLAVVQGMAQQSFKDPRVPPELRAAFEGRLSALGAAHNVLTRESWQSAPLRQIVEDAVQPFGSSRFDVAGPELRIAPKAAVSIALTIHELSTNASKYGALSTDAGRVAIRWSVEEAGSRIFRLDWREEGGPNVKPPSRRGFGSRLIERGLATELGGRATVDYHPEGVRWSVEAPLDMLET